MTDEEFEQKYRVAIQDCSIPFEEHLDINFRFCFSKLDEVNNNRKHSCSGCRFQRDVDVAKFNKSIIEEF